MDRTIGHYEVLEKLGAGGMGEVYRARDTKLGRDVALKMLPENLAQDPARVERLTREARAVAGLNHPNIVTLHSIEESDGRHFITMECVSGQTLERAIGREGMAIDRLLDIATPLAEALAAAHDVGVVHRDLKPANIMVGDDGRPKILDFGLAKQTAPRPEGASAMETEPLLTQEGTVVGTLPYMSPEQLQGSLVDARTDIYALGAMLYEMATGTRPHAGKSHAELISAILRDTPPPAGELRDDLPSELERLIARCLEKEPARRMQTARDVFNELDTLRASHVAQATPSARPSQPTRSRSRERRRVPVVLGGLAVALVAMALVWQSRSGCATGPTDPSVAVLPFTNSSGDPETEYLSAGITEILINRLSENSSLRVMSRHSVARFDDAATDPRDAGRQLGVASVITGYVDVRGDKLVVGAELLDVEDGRQMWGNRFERDKTEFLTVEREIAAKIGEKLRRQLPGRAASNDARAGGDIATAAAETIDPEAYDLYLRGRYLMLGTSNDGPSRAQELFRQAIEREPRFALAYAALGESYVKLAWFNSRARERTVPQAKAALQRALQLDDQLSEAYVLAGEIALYFDWDWEAAGEAYRKAIELKPENDLAHREYASYLSLMARYEEAIAEARVAQKLDPLSVYASHQLGYNLMVAGRLREAAAEFEKALDLNPTWVWGNIKVGLTYALLGEIDKARAAAQRADALLGDDLGSPLAQGWLAQNALLCGDPSRMRETLARLEAPHDGEFVEPVAMADMYYQLGDYDRMLAYLEKGYEVRSPMMVYMLIQRRFMWKDVANDPRYLSLVDRMGFPRPSA